MKTIVVISDAEDDVEELRGILEEIYTLSVYPYPDDALERLRTDTRDIAALLLDHPGTKEGSRELSQGRREERWKRRRGDGKFQVALWHLRLA